jgi:hypothetical protein
MDFLEAEAAIDQHSSMVCLSPGWRDFDASSILILPVEL